jgi:hypothetical protein
MLRTRVGVVGVGAARQGGHGVLVVGVVVGVGTPPSHIQRGGRTAAVGCGEAVVFEGMSADPTATIFSDRQLHYIGAVAQEVITQKNSRWRYRPSTNRDVHI